MAQGYDAFYQVLEHYKGWGDTTAQTKGVYLELESDSLSPGGNVKERDSKIIVGREAKRRTFSVEGANPGGNFVAEPRTDDFLSIFMAFFQCVDYGSLGESGSVGTGTFTFVPANTNPDWTGSQWGSVHGGTEAVAKDIYPIRIRKCFGFTFDYGLDAGGFGTLHNTENYAGGIVESLEFSQPYGEDLTLTPTFKFYDVDMDASTGTEYEPNCTYGSYSEKSRFVDWKGTVTYNHAGNATSLDLANVGVTLNNNTSDKGKIGKKGWNKFPFSGRPVLEGSFDLELESGDFARVFEAGGSSAIKMTWYNSALDWMELHLPCTYWRAFDRPVGAGDAPIDYSLPFRAYPIGTLPGVIFKVCTVFATSGLSMNLGSGRSVS